MLEKTEGRRKGTTEDEMVGWNPQVSDRSLSKIQEMVKDREVWCAVVYRGHKESDMTE